MPKATTKFCNLRTMPILSTREMRLRSTCLWDSRPSQNPSHPSIFMTSEAASCFVRFAAAGILLDRTGIRDY